MEFYGEFQLTRKGKPYLIVSESGTKTPIFAPKLLGFLGSCAFVKSGRGDLIREHAVIYGKKTHLNGRETIHALKIKILSTIFSNWTIGVGDPPMATFSDHTFSGFMYAEEGQNAELSLNSDFLDSVIIENSNSVFDAIQSGTCEPSSWPAYFERVSGQWMWSSKTKRAVITDLLVWRGAEMYEVFIPEIVEE